MTPEGGHDREICKHLRSGNRLGGGGVSITTTKLHINKIPVLADHSIDTQRVDGCRGEERAPGCFHTDQMCASLCRLTHVLRFCSLDYYVHGDYIYPIWWNRIKELSLFWSIQVSTRWTLHHQTLRTFCYITSCSGQYEPDPGPTPDIPAQQTPHALLLPSVPSLFHLPPNLFSLFFNSHSR